MTDEPRELQEYKTDHDLLIELNVLMREMRRDMRDMKDGTTAMLNDHETRIRTLEASNNSWLGKQSLIGGAIGTVVTLIGSYISAGKL